MEYNIFNWFLIKLFFLQAAREIKFWLTGLWFSVSCCVNEEEAVVILIKVKVHEISLRPWDYFANHLPVGWYQPVELSAWRRKRASSNEKRKRWRLRLGVKVASSAGNDRTSNDVCPAHNGRGDWAVSVRQHRNPFFQATRVIVGIITFTNRKERG